MSKGKSLEGRVGDQAPEFDVDSYLVKPGADQNRKRWRDHSGQSMKYGSEDTTVVDGVRYVNGYDVSTTTRQTGRLTRFEKKAENLLAQISQGNWAAAREEQVDLEKSNPGRHLYGNKSFNDQFLGDTASLILQRASVDAYVRTDKVNGGLAGYVIQQK